MSMKFTPTAIFDVILIEPKVFGDERGFFMETFRSDEFAAANIPTSFVQDNHSGSRRGILRGLHYQLRHPQGKLVRAIAGEIFDVVVDIRKHSPSFGKWEGFSLSAQNKCMLWVPPCLAHGFYVVSEWAEVVYKATDYYAPEWERTLLWNDPEIGIQWPLKDGVEVQLSPKDRAGKPLREAELYE
jgi:dTDP-4-dehydrorhamnose 3,5-epimerase